MAAKQSTAIADDDIVVEDHGISMTFIGTAAALAEAWLILPEWVPAPPKRLAESVDFGGWWWINKDGRWGGEEEEDWDRRPPDVERWSLRRRAGGRLEFRLNAYYWRFYLGGPVDNESGARAAEWHRRMVRARADRQFQAFMAQLVPAPE